MSRRIIITPHQIQVRRAENWARHYERRALARVMSVSPSMLESLAELPPSVLAIDASLEERSRIERVFLAELSARYRMARELMCLWYWSESGWMDFVRAFQNLPEPVSDYYAKYNSNLDVILLLPVPVDNLLVTCG